MHAVGLWTHRELFGVLGNHGLDAKLNGQIIDNRRDGLVRDGAAVDVQGGN